MPVLSRIFLSMKYIAAKDLILLEALTLLSPESSKTTLRSWLSSGRILVDGTVEKKGTFLVKEGQVISMGAKPIKPEEGLKILFEDAHLVIIDKPIGMLSVSAAFEKSNTVHAILKRKYHPRRVYVIHRLDQDTSGVMMFALNEKAYTAMKKIFEKHEIERAYTAIVEGVVEKEEGTWKSYLYEDPNYVVRETNDTIKGELAVTHFKVEKRSKKYTWLTTRLETGKKNQIRVHTQSAGHPIAGDKKYGAITSPIKRLCLHAHLLAFVHPITKKQMRFESPIPAEFTALFP